MKTLAIAMILAIAATTTVDAGPPGRRANRHPSTSGHCRPKRHGSVDHARQFTKIGGQTTSVHKWQMETLVRTEGRWLLVGVADGLIPPEPSAIPVDVTVLDAYVGDYEWAPTLVSKVRRRDRALYEEFPTQGESELAAEAPATFFIKGVAASGDASRIIFVKDTAGRVTHYIYRELGATDRIVKKIR